MAQPESQPEIDINKIALDLIGYLNFSNGSPDVRFQTGLNQLFANPQVDSIREFLDSQIASLAESESAFANSQQASSVIQLVCDVLAPAYRAHHSDLLFHLPDEDFEQPFLLARMFEAALEQGGPWNETERIVPAAIDRLNDFIGFRPVAVLENGQKCQPYDNERFRPVPLYVRDAGVAAGKYQELIEHTLSFLRDTPEEILFAAHFDPNLLDELALDVRAHDHNHPANKRTNYMFGEWDPHVIDNSGFYRRFLLRQIILDALLHWMDEQTLPPEEVLHDASAVLCGTMLMASSISGAGPNTYDSTVSLTTLLPVVARQRDAFYMRLLNNATGQRSARLHAAAQQTQQPFGHVRHKLNMHLAGYGARQVQHRHIAWMYARMGFSDASREEAAAIPSLSVRFECELQCRITEARREIEHGRVDRAVQLLEEIEDYLQRGIHCGALIDPWNILGFQGQFPLFSAREDAVPDSRVEVLLEIMERTFGVFSRAMSEAAAQGQGPLVEKIAAQFRRLADKWDQYATNVVDDLPNVLGRDSYESAEHVARALAEWREAGESAGDISFWRQHVDRFESAKAYALVVQALLQKQDSVASMGLLMQWLSEAEESGLESGPYSIYPLLVEWMTQTTESIESNAAAEDQKKPADTKETADTTDEQQDHDPWPIIRRLFDYLEANSGEFWHVPNFESFIGPITDNTPDEEAGFRQRDPSDFEDEDDGENSIFRAAYDDVVFRDSADDGQFGETLDGGFNPGNTEFEIISRHFEPRLRFLTTVAYLWQMAAAAIATAEINRPHKRTEEKDDTLMIWYKHLSGVQDKLRVLMDDVWEYEISTALGDTDTNIEYDVQLQSKFLLLHNIIATSVSCHHAQRLLRCCITRKNTSRRRSPEELIVTVCRGVFRRDTNLLRDNLPELLQYLSRQPLLYAPLESGGHPAAICKARSLQSLMRFLLTQLPHMGLLQETRQLVQTAYAMERTSRPGRMAVTEFDRLFRCALRNSMEYIVNSSSRWRSGKFADEELIEFLREVLDQYLPLWTMHSSTMRLSRVEELKDPELAEDVREFIEKYGSDLFHARMLTLGNIRAILHNGIDAFLEHLDESSDPLTRFTLLDDLDEGRVDTQDAIDYLELIYESIVDKFDRFLEYNTTTTQSDYGEKFYCLLDFLKAESAYERDAWNLTPVQIVHEALTQANKVDAAVLWEEDLQHNTSDIADMHQADLTEIEQLHGVRLPSIRDRLNERFVKPLAVNRMVALVPQSASDARREKTPSHAFEKLQSEIRAYLDSTFGSGIDLPPWLYSLDKEVSSLDASQNAGVMSMEEPTIKLPPVKINLRQMQRQLRVLGDPLKKPGKPRPKKKSTKKKKDE